jgi:hypothetical protein
LTELPLNVNVFINNLILACGDVIEGCATCTSSINCTECCGSLIMIYDSASASLKCKKECPAGTVQKGLICQSNFDINDYPLYSAIPSYINIDQAWLFVTSNYSYINFSYSG